MELTQQALTRILEEYREKVSRTKLDEDAVNNYMQTVSDKLFDYCSDLPEGTEFDYRIQVRFRRVVLKIIIPGKKKILTEDGAGSPDAEVLKRIHSMRITYNREAPYLYFMGKNILRFSTQTVDIRKQTVIRNPIIIAILAGLAAGILCSLLPENISGTIVSDITSPVLNVAIKLITGAMVPIVFFSLVTAISTVDSISEFSRLGSRFFRKFILISIFLSVIAMIVALAMFTIDRGNMDTHVSIRLFTDLLLSIIPLNVVTPFAEGNFPQLMVLGIVMGIALLLIGKQIRVLDNLLLDLRDWMNELLNIVLKIVPIIPGLSLFQIFAQNDFAKFLQGWKYITAAYVCMIIVLLVKAVHVKRHVKGLSLSKLFRKTWPAAKIAFLSGGEVAIVSNLYEISENDLSIPTGFTGLWIPLNQVMLAPIAPIYYILDPCFTAEITGMPVSITFLFMLFLLTVGLSLAYPGHIAGITIIFNALGLPSDYIGMFSAYSVLIKNAAAAFGTFYRFLELTDIAYATGNFDVKKFSAS